MPPPPMRLERAQASFTTMTDVEVSYVAKMFFTIEIENIRPYKLKVKLNVSLTWRSREVYLRRVRQSQY